MYVGGGAVDHEQSYLLGGIVVICKSWRWAALVYSAVRIAALACNNSIGSFDPSLVVCDENETSESTTSTQTPVVDFRKLTEETWLRVDSLCKNLMYDVDVPQRIGRHVRSTQSENVGIQLASLKQTHAAEVEGLFSGSD